jgi:hypothetical protein
LGNFYICENYEELIEILLKYSEIGADEVMWADLSTDPDEMMKLFRMKIIPSVRESQGTASSSGRHLYKGSRHDRIQRGHVSKT